MEIVDDSKLLQLAAPRASELFPLFQRAASLRPWLILLAILPGLFALQSRALDNNAAYWGLRSLGMLSSASAEYTAAGDQQRDALMIKWQPPLGSWLTSRVFATIGPSRWIGLVIWSYLATIGLVFSAYYLARRLVGPRFAFWTVLLLACHPVVLKQVQDPAPHSLALFAALVTFWGYIAHRQDEETLVSLKLLTSGIALGLCLLAGGPLAIVVFGTLFVHVLALRGDSLSPGRKPLPQRRHIWTGWPALESLLVVAATAFAVGGWWVMMMFWQYGWAFWTGWLTGATADAQLPPAATSSVIAGRFLNLSDGVFGLSALGFWRACREMLQPTDETRRRRMQFLMAWALAAITVWLIFARNPATAPFVQTLWDGFLILPCTAFAALGIDEISRRKVSIPAAVAACCVSIIAIMAVPSLRLGEPLPTTRIAVFVVSVVVALILGGRIIDAVRTRKETRNRLILTCIIVAQLAVNAALGLASVHRSASREQTSLINCRRELSNVDDVASCTMVREKEADPPPTLWFVLRSLWPDSDMRQVESWDEALSPMLTDPRVEEGTVVVVDWSSRDTLPTNIHVEGLQVDAVTRPQVFMGRQVRAYRVTLDR